MDEFIVQLLAQLDTSKVIKDYNVLKEKLEKQINIKVILDTSSQNDISKLSEQLQTALYKVSDGKLNLDISQITSALDQVSKNTQTTGQQIENVINKSVTKAKNDLKSFTDLTPFTELNKKINDFHVDTSELKNYKSILDEVKNTYFEFGQVKITNEIFKDGVLEKFKVNIEQVNGDLKETKSFIMSLNDEKDAFVFSGLISGSESVVQHLDKTKNAVNQTAEAINALKEKTQIDKIQLSMDNGYGASKYQNHINSIIASLEKYGVETEEAKKITASLQSTFDSMKGMSGQELVDQANKLETEFKAVKASVDQAKIAYDKYMQPVTNEKATYLINRINTFLSKNTKITKDARIELEGYAQELSKGVNLSRWNEISGKLNETENSMRGLHKLGLSFKNQMSQAMSSFSMWFSASSIVMKFISQTREAVSELKEVNTILTEISKTSNLTKNQLEAVGNASFETASKYGNKASDYLLGVQEMYRAGYQNAEELAELSVLVQSAGDLDADLANDYILASDAAYRYSGNVEKLNLLLDSQNQVTNRNAVSMEELANATKVAASQLANSNISENEMTALLGTGIATTKEAGEVVGRAVKGIIMNLQQVKGETGFEGEVIDEESLKKVEARCHSVGVELEYMKDGIARLRDPMDILKELAEVYNSLPNDSAEKAGILSDIGGKYRSNVLSSILSNWDKYEKMLADYENASGSAMEEAMKSANNWEGSLNRLSNTWTDTIGNIANSDAIITIINGLNGILSVVNGITDALGSFGTINTVVSAIAGAKGLGLTSYNYCYI